MINWSETLPGWWMPRTATYDAARWPDYTQPGYTDALTRAPDLTQVIKVLDFGRPDRRAWAAWINAYNRDRALRFDLAFHGPVADRLYETARYKFLVPAWRRAIIDIVTELDDVEDQISTIIWVMEWITAKVIPIPRSVMNGADRVQRSLDCAEKVIAGITPFRFRKTEYAD